MSLLQLRDDLTSGIFRTIWGFEAEFLERHEISHRKNAGIFHRAVFHYEVTAKMRTVKLEARSSSVQDHESAYRAPYPNRLVPLVRSTTPLRIWVGQTHEVFFHWRFNATIWLNWRNRFPLVTAHDWCLDVLLSASDLSRKLDRHQKHRWKFYENSISGELYDKEV